MIGYDLSNFNFECGRRIAELRRDAGYSSQEKLAEAIGVSKPTITKIETGNVITERNFNKIVALLQCTPEYILTGKEEVGDEEKMYNDWFANLPIEDKKLFFGFSELLKQRSGR